MKSVSLLQELGFHMYKRSLQILKGQLQYQVMKQRILLLQSQRTSYDKGVNYMRYFIVDDDRASRMMLANIIEDGQLGTVIGEATNGEEAIHQILTITT